MRACRQKDSCHKQGRRRWLSGCLTPRIRDQGSKWICSENLTGSANLVDPTRFREVAVRTSHHRLLLPVGPFSVCVRIISFRLAIHRLSWTCLLRLSSAYKDQDWLAQRSEEEPPTDLEVRIRCERRSLAREGQIRARIARPNV